MKITSILFLIFILNLIPSILVADSVKIRKTGTTYENVKATIDNKIVRVDFEDGSQKKFRLKDVKITYSEVVWLSKEKKDPGFFDKAFGSSDKSTEPVSEQEPKPEVIAVSEAKPATDKQDETSTPYLGEGIFGSVALLFFLLP